MLGEQERPMGEVTFDICEGCLDFDKGTYGSMARRMLQVKGTG